MQPRFTDSDLRHRNPVREFGRKLNESFGKGNFVRLVLSHPIQRERGVERVLGRCVQLKGTTCLSVTSRYPTRDEVKNLTFGEAVEWVMARVENDFRSALLCTTERDWQLSIGQNQKGRLIAHPPSVTTVPDREHDQARRSILGDTAADWLHGLGVTDRAGHVRPGMADKYRQISRYTEILSHLGRECGWSTPENTDPGELVIADMGCGKGYLTFGAWHLFHRIWHVPVQVIGIEARADLVAATNKVAERIAAEHLAFVEGSIATSLLPRIDALIALHACDTATDQAIERGVRAGARLVVVAPCCQKEVRAKLGRPAPLAPLLQHGLLEERLAEWVTDGLRALVLEWAGYRTKVFEFVSSEHTAKNVMIAAIRQGKPFSDLTIRKQIDELRTFFGIKSHSLDGLLDGPLEQA